MRYEEVIPELKDVKIDNCFEQPKHRLYNPAYVDRCIQNIEKALAAIKVAQSLQVPVKETYSMNPLKFIVYDNYLCLLVPENLYISQCKHIDEQPNPYCILTNRLLELLEDWRAIKCQLQAPVTEVVEELIKSIRALS